jgi:rhamnosyltransferase
MDESLFIDNVDLEWGFRASARGWALIGAPKALLAHNIGDDHVAAPRWARAFGKDRAIRHGPERLYYITRNRIRLYWMPHVPLSWKAQDLLRLPAKIVLSLWMAQDRKATAKALARGVFDGAANRGGPMRRR